MFPSAFSPVQSLFYGLAPTLRPKRYMWPIIVMSVTALCAIGGADRMQYVVPAELATQEVTAPKPSAPAPESSAPAAAPASAPQPEASAAIPNCVPPKQKALSPTNLTNQPIGLTRITDATNHYRIYGNTRAQVKAQLLRCPAVVKGGHGFGAVTNGYVTWQYLITPDNTGACNLTGVKVGLHTGMVLPMWQPTNAASSGLAAEWQRLISNLELHENGHVAIYQQQAKQLLSDLQSLPAASCETMASAAEAKAAAHMSALDTAHSDYDAHTNHGVAQGAVLH